MPGDVSRREFLERTAHAPLRAGRDLNTRMQYARDIGRSFEWDRPDFERPALPDPPEIVTSPCCGGRSCPGRLTPL
jgi:hypothetical protein